MDSMIYNKMLHTPIYTGTPGEPPKSRPREKQTTMHLRNCWSRD